MRATMITVREVRQQREALDSVVGPLSRIESTLELYEMVLRALRAGGTSNRDLRTMATIALGDDIPGKRARNR